MVEVERWRGRTQTHHKALYKAPPSPRARTPLKSPRSTSGVSMSPSPAVKSPRTPRTPRTPRAPNLPTWDSTDMQIPGHMQVLRQLYEHYAAMEEEVRHSSKCSPPPAISLGKWVMHGIYVVAISLSKYLAMFFLKQVSFNVLAQ